MYVEIIALLVEAGSICSFKMPLMAQQHALLLLQQKLKVLGEWQDDSKGIQILGLTARG